MKILVVTLSLSRSAGGLFYSVRNLSIALKKQGVKLSVLGLKDRYYDRDLPEWGDLDVTGCDDLGLFGKYGFSIQFLYRVVFSKCDILYLNGIWNFASFAVLIRSFVNPGTPVVLAPRGMLDSWILSRHGIAKKIFWLLFEKRLVGRVHLIQALNSSEEEEIEALGFGRTFICPNGTWISNNVVSKNNIHRRLIFMGRIDPKKGVVELLDAWQKTNRPDWELIFYGWGDDSYVKEFSSKVDLAKKLGVNVSYAGPVFGEEKQKALDSSGAFVLPSYSEGLPMAVLEAWASGLPVAMTVECNLPEAFDVGVAKRITLGDELPLQLDEFMDWVEGNYPILTKATMAYVEKNYEWGELARCFLEAVSEN